MKKNCPTCAELRSQYESCRRDGAQLALLLTRTAQHEQSAHPEHLRSRNGESFPAGRS